MNEEEFKAALQNMLQMQNSVQNNNDQNFQILQAQIDRLQTQLNELNDLKEMFRLPKPQNKDRKLFDEKE
jgi:prefoldin subunit 5